MTRGTMVLGFWQWMLPELDWGRVPEIDVNEGYGPVKNCVHRCSDHTSGNTRSRLICVLLGKKI